MIEAKRFRHTAVAAYLMKHLEENYPQQFQHLKENHEPAKQQQQDKLEAK